MCKAYCAIHIAYIPISLIVFLFDLLLQTYMAPWLAVFVDPLDAESAMYNNFRVFGTGLLCIMGKFCFIDIHFHNKKYILADLHQFLYIFKGTIVFIGVKFVNKFAAVALACVIFSIIAVYVGIFDNFNGNDKL